MKNKKKLLIFLCIGFVLLLAFLLTIVFSLKSYHDKNTWATFEITGDGVFEGQTSYPCTPDVNVVEYNGIKSYGRGETIVLEYASFTVERVDIGTREGVTISSEEDILFNDQTLHSVYLNIGESCTIKGSDQSFVVTLVDIGYQ